MGTRTEKDFPGSKELPEAAYYGVQTLRGKENFHITGIPMSTEPYFVKAFGYVKKAAALADRDLGVLDARIADANEVIANMALETLGHRKGEYQHVSPNDHVNFGQSTNNVYPTAFRLALILRLNAYMKSLSSLQDAFFAKGREFERVLKMGRTTKSTLARPRSAPR